jgi:hypothetical protein
VSLHRIGSSGSIGSAGLSSVSKARRSHCTRASESGSGSLAQHQRGSSGLRRMSQHWKQWRRPNRLDRQVGGGKWADRAGSPSSAADTGAGKSARSRGRCSGWRRGSSDSRRFWRTGDDDPIPLRPLTVQFDVLPTRYATTRGCGDKLGIALSRPQKVAKPGLGTLSNSATDCVASLRFL